MRAIVWIFTACAIGIAAGFLILGLGTFQAGVWIAVAAALVLVGGLLNALRRDRDLMRRGRDAEWQRRITANHISGLGVIRDMKPWPIGDDEVRP